MRTAIVAATGWLGSVMVRALDLRLDCREFDSQSWRCQTTVLGKLLTPMYLCQQAVIDTPLNALAPYPWSRYISWCLNY